MSDPQPRYRMKDLCELTGLSRQAIHFYIQQGLVPEGRKTGRNMAYYGHDHLERLQLVRRLQHERFLPLKTIKAILDGKTAGYADTQRAMLVEVRSRLAGALGTDAAPPRTVDAAAAAARHGVSDADLRRMGELGFLAISDGRIAADSMWLLELWSQVRGAGFDEELGFSVDDLGVYAEAVASLFQREAELLLQRLAHLPPERVAAMVERILPLVHAFIGHYHTAQVRSFFDSIPEES